MFQTPSEFPKPRETNCLIFVADPRFLLSESGELEMMLVEVAGTYATNWKAREEAGTGCPVETGNSSTKGR
jgi:hypothetical protein